MPLILNPYAFAPLSLAFQTSANSSAQTITCPTVEQYDVGVLFDNATDATATTPTNVIPSGFTQLQTSIFSAFYRTTLSYKVFDGTEDGATLTGMNGAHSNAKILLVFRPNRAITGVGTSTFLEETSTGTPASQLIAASGQSAPLIRLATCVNGGGASIPNFTGGTFDSTVGKAGSDNSLRAGYAIQNTTPSDTTVSMGDNGAGNCLMSGWMNFS
jgi:hypothetical protein